MSTDQSQSLHTAASNSISRHPSAVTKSVAIDTVLNFSCCFFFFLQVTGKKRFFKVWAFNFEHFFVEAF